MATVVIGVVGAVVLGFVGLFVLLKVATFFVPLYEKRPVRFLAPAPADDPERARLSPAAHASPTGQEGEFNPYESPKGVEYASAQNLAAAALGFRSDGLYAHAKGGTYKVHFAPWLSPDRRTLAVVGWGTMLGINASKTLLYSRLEDGRILVSCDKIPGNDTPGLYEIVVVLNAPFDVLVRRHERRLADSVSPAVPFDGADARADYEAIARRRHEFLIGKKQEYYIDPEQTAVRSTLKGALVLFLRSWKVPGYVEKIPSPGAEPVAFRAKPDKLTATLRNIEWVFLFLVLFPVFLSYQRVRTPNQALFHFGLTAFGLAGLAAVWLVRLARKFGRRG